MKLLILFISVFILVISVVNVQGYRECYTVFISLKTRTTFVRSIQFSTIVYSASSGGDPLSAIATCTIDDGLTVCNGLTVTSDYISNSIAITTIETIATPGASIFATGTVDAIVSGTLSISAFKTSIEIDEAFVATGTVRATADGSIAATATISTSIITVTASSYITCSGTRSLSCATCIAKPDIESSFITIQCARVSALTSITPLIPRF